MVRCLEFFKMQVWSNFRASHKADFARTKMSYINNAKHISLPERERDMLTSSKNQDFPARLNKEPATPKDKDVTRSIINRPVTRGVPKKGTSCPAVQGNGGSFSRPEKLDQKSKRLKKIWEKKRLDKGLPIG